jgi:hypothetical protein
MSLGIDNTICKTEFVEAMRQRLAADDPSIAANVDLPAVQANLGALGEAVRRIATLHADTSSSSTVDATFWTWIATINTWLNALSTWQVGVATAFQNWTPGSDAAFRNAVIGLAAPGLPPTAAPTSLTGKIL